MSLQQEPHTPSSVGAFGANPPTVVGEDFYKAGKFEQAAEAFLTAAAGEEIPSASICLMLARCYEQLGDFAQACRWALAVVDAGDDFSSWQTATTLLKRCTSRYQLNKRRSARLAIVGSYTTRQLVQQLWLAARRLGISLEIYESQYGQYRQDIVDSNSPMYGFAPDFVVLAVHDSELALPEFSEAPQTDVDAEIDRWKALWKCVTQHSTARVVQFNFALPCEIPMGHLGARLAASRYTMAQTVNMRLGEEAGSNVSIVDCERLSALFGKRQWFDPRFWHLAKQAVSLTALPLLARHTAAVIAADLGLSRKCLVLDLDGTLWGGVIGEDGLAGIALGDGVDGEAFVSFQEYILKLKNKGVILAVCSKNNEIDARLPFEKHPEMRIKLDDFAIFVANWQPKPENIRAIAKTLDIGLDTLVFVDDNPVERAAVRELVPEVDVVRLPADPAQFTRALSQYLLFETSWFTPEDAKRTDQYQARARIMELEASAASLEEFHRGLHMQALVAPFDDFHLPRIAQLLGKTNQFNLTTRRHGVAQLRAFMENPACANFFMRLRDRFSDHGLVSLMIAQRQGSVLDIDSWLMSCRVIGRTVEATMLARACEWANRLGCESIRGTYIPTAQNEMVKGIYGKYGFELIGVNDGAETWSYDLQKHGPITNEFIQLVESWGNSNGAA